MPDSLQTDWAEVANRLIDKSGEAISFLSDKVQETAPVAWAIAKRQVYAEMVSDIAIPLGITICLLAVRWVISKTWKEPDEEDNRYEWSDWDMTINKVFPILSAIPAVISCIVFLNYIRVLINPDYYAILKILEMSGLK
jgi:hypothetical protein